VVRSRLADLKHSRIVFDFTTSAMWTGPPVGIVRVESALARWGLDHAADFTPAFFDPKTGGFCELGRDMVRRLMAQDAVIDSLSFVSPARQGRRKTDRIPPALQPLALWFLQSRRMTLQALERLRLATANARTAALLDALQRTIMSERHRALMIKPDGSRRAYLPVKAVIGAPVELGIGDTLVCAGSGWTHTDIAAIAGVKRGGGCRLVLLCYDIIPLMFPHFFRAADVAAHRAYCAIAFPAADLVLFSSRTIEKDVRAWCGANGIALGATAIVPFGADLPAAPGTLPAGLEAGRYALLVSTIEPRKGHRLILDAWRELLAAGVPQRVGFKLAFAGRVGWMVGDLMADLTGDPRLAATVMVITDAGDAELAALYRDAAFCLYPSRYEGFGLPVIEAFRRGKAVLASTGGAVPEVVHDLSPCLDPDDAPAWRGMLQTFIEEPAARAPYEERIRSSFRHPDWDEAAARFFAVLGRSIAEGARRETSAASLPRITRSPG